MMARDLLEARCVEKTVPGEHRETQDQEWLNALANAGTGASKRGKPALKSHPLGTLHSWCCYVVVSIALDT
ncbi:hypothetical protein DIE23_05260 [Burkholderia sp. Bp9143]|nr:hypothetical protein DIE23_05260 [Burkholderia sp. Bp9143]